MKFFIYTILISSFILTQELSSRYHDFYEIEEKIIQWDEQFGNNTDPYEIYPGESVSWDFPVPGIFVLKSINLFL